MKDHKPIRLGLLQATPEYLQLDANLKKFERFANEAKRAGVDLFVTCEGYLDGICAQQDKGDTAVTRKYRQDPANSPYLDRVREIAKETGMHIVFGFTSKVGDEAANSAIFIDEGGMDIGIYDKTHLRLDDRRFVRGEGFKVFPSKFGSIGLLICKDRNYPESSKVLKLMGAELIVVCSYGGWSELNEWQMRVRARENEVHLAFAHPKTSVVCDAVGELVAKLTTNVESVLVCDVDLSQRPTEKLRRRRPEIYGKIAERR
jgi:predicted amidohydrolase